MPREHAIVADQDWNLRNVLRQHLDANGYITLVTPIAGEAEDFARRIDAGVVLLDSELPGISAYEACARIRRMPGYDRVPIILTTRAATTRRRLAAERAGASMLMLKPFSMRELMWEIERIRLGTASDARTPTAEDGILGFAELPVKVWERAPDLRWRFGQDSELSTGRRTLEMMRLANRPSDTRSR
jgi:DNA-binding response OmpR family regulator